MSSSAIWAIDELKESAALVHELPEPDRSRAMGCEVFIFPDFLFSLGNCVGEAFAPCLRSSATLCVFMWI
jgi:hypothetical protein